MDKEIEEILNDIEQFFLTAGDAELEYWQLAPDERAQLPDSVRVPFESLAE